jgi:hypothetical protein
MQRAPKRTRPLRGVNGKVCSKKDLTESALLEMPVYPGALRLADHSVVTEQFRRVFHPDGLKLVWRDARMQC